MSRFAAKAPDVVLDVSGGIHEVISTLIKMIYDDPKKGGMKGAQMLEARFGIFFILNFIYEEPALMFL